MRAIAIVLRNNEIKTEADSNDIAQYQHDDTPSTGMIVLHYECILCTTFAFVFITCISIYDVYSTF